MSSTFTPREVQLVLLDGVAAGGVFGQMDCVTAVVGLQIAFMGGVPSHLQVTYRFAAVVNASSLVQSTIVSILGQGGISQRPKQFVQVC